MTDDFASRRRVEGMSRDELAAGQLARLNELLDRILPANAFYKQKFARVALPLRSWGDFHDLPFTTKEELAVGDPVHGLPANLTWPIERYVRFHQTSGTHGRP